MNDDTFSFGPFTLLKRQRLLLDGSRAISIGSRALDILILLVENAGTVVESAKIISCIWEDRVVDGTNLRVHIAALRKTLGDGHNGTRYITNVPGRGYSFVAPVALSGQPTNSQFKPLGISKSRVRLIGQDHAIDLIADLLKDKKFITITGPGGIGKTSLAQAVEEKVRDEYADGVVFVDLSTLTDAEFVTDAVSQAFGFTSFPNGSAKGFARQLSGMNALLVLDNCEHLVESVAFLAETLLADTSQLHLLATSREPLRARGEWVQRVASLELPNEEDRFSAKQAMAFPAIELFTERANAALDSFELTEDDVTSVINICRRLDGIPLAIELAASSLTHFSVQELEARLVDRFAILTRGRRTALPRHRTLRATMASSYDLLTPQEKSVFRKLSIFAGTFTLDAACRILADRDPDLDNAADLIFTLIDKSLVTTKIRGEKIRYRLLETTRAYALEKLVEDEDYDALARCHAVYYQQFYERAEQSYMAEDVTSWREQYLAEIENFRAAINWTFGEHGDPDLGIRLVACAAPVYVHQSLLTECKSYLDLALQALDRDPSHAPGERKKILAHYGNILMQIAGKSEEAIQVWNETLEIASRENDVDYRLRSLWGLMTLNFQAGEMRVAIEFATRFSRLSEQSQDPVAQTVANRILGNAYCAKGELAKARTHIEAVLGKDEISFTKAHIMNFQFDHLAVARSTYSKILWLQGYPDQALQMALSAHKYAMQRGHIASLHYVLAHAACPIAFYVGNVEIASYLVDTFEDKLKGHMPTWDAWVACYRAQIGYLFHHDEQALIDLKEAHDSFPAISLGKRKPEFILTLAKGLAKSGRADQAIQLIDDAQTKSAAGGEDWIVPEYMRVKGEVLAAEASPHCSEEAEALFRNSMDLAARQTALSWELRSAISLANLLLAQGLRKDAEEILAPVYQRFNEGFKGTDLMNANLLLERARA